MLTGFSLLKSSCISTPTTKFLRCIACGKAIENGLCSWRIQDISQVRNKQISESNVAIMIQTAGDNGAVAQNANVIPHAITKHPVTLDGCRQIRPVELIAVFQINSLADADTPALNYPRFWEVIA